MNSDTIVELTASAPVVRAKEASAAANHYRDAKGFNYERFWGEPPAERRWNSEIKPSKVAGWKTTTPGEQFLKTTDDQLLA